MRILVLNYEFPPIGGGGGSASAALCRELVERGHELQVLTSRGPGTSRWQRIDGYRVRRVATRRRSRSRASLFSMAAYVIGGLIPGLALIRSWKPAVLHAHFAVPTGALALLLSRLTGVPYVLTTHLGDVPGGVPEKTGVWFRFIKPFTPPIWKAAGHVIAVSEYTRRLARAAYEVPISVIPNGVRLPGPGQISPVVGDPPRLIFVGRFQPQKNLLSLVTTLQALQDMPWSCVLVGDGPLADALRRMIGAAGLEQRISLTGWVSNQRVMELMAESDILVMPSLSEGLPVVGVQALAYGLAIVASEAGGLADLVRDQVNGRLCPIGNQQSFTHALRWALQDRQRLKRMKRASRELAAGYDIRTVATAYEPVLSAVAGTA